MPKIAVIAVGAVGLSQLHALEQRQPWRDSLKLELCYVGSDTFSKADWPTAFACVPNADLLLLDLMGMPKDFCVALTTLVQGFPGQLVVLHGDSATTRALTRLGSFRMAEMNQHSGAEGSGSPTMAMMQRMTAALERAPSPLHGKLRDMRNYFWLIRYWQFASPSNIEQMVRLLARDYLGFDDLPEPEPPQTLDLLTICEPATRRPYPDLGHYQTDFPPMQKQRQRQRNLATLI